MTGGAERPDSRTSRWPRIAGATLVVCLSVIAGLWWLARPPEPDAFYAAAPLKPSRHGTLLRHAAFSRDVPQGARGWRILYTTTRADGAPATASGIVVTATNTNAKPRPVIAWAHGTTGIAPGCAPSLMRHPFANVPALNALLDAGWVFVASDYAGLGTNGGHAYLVGDEAARGVLDAVRAARHIPGLALARRTVVWGHSQGGNSALWAGIEAPAYVPEIDLRGVAALAPASDLVGLMRSSRASMFGKIVSAYILASYAHAYPDVHPAVYSGRWSRAIAADIAGRCVGGPGTLVSVAETLLVPREGIFDTDPAAGALGARLAQNTPAKPILAPLMIAQGMNDDLVLPEVQKTFVASRCATGQTIDFRLFPGLDHVSLVAADSALVPELMTWTADRLAGKPAAPSCILSSNE